jgi:hypothetical protein
MKISFSPLTLRDAFFFAAQLIKIGIKEMKPNIKSSKKKIKMAHIF